jgi:hypothetical protein
MVSLFLRLLFAFLDVKVLALLTNTVNFAAALRAVNGWKQFTAFERPFGRQIAPRCGDGSM